MTFGYNFRTVAKLGNYCLCCRQIIILNTFGMDNLTATATELIQEADIYFINDSLDGDYPRVQSLKYDNGFDHKVHKSKCGCLC